MRARSRLGPLLSLLSLPVVMAGAGDQARAESPVLRGPHPFLKENEVTFHAGYGVATTFSGMRTSAGYGTLLDRNLWLDLRVDFLNGQQDPPIVPGSCSGCGDVTTFANVLAGVKYKLQTNIPLVPYASVVAGPVYLFRREAGSSWGLGARAAVGGRYFLFDWLGFGVELGGLVARVRTGDSGSLSPTLGILDLSVGAEVQF